MAGRPVAAGVHLEYLRRTRRDLPELFSPPAVPAAQAGIDHSEIVLGVAMGGEAKAYSTSSLRRHHIVNDRVGGQPVVVTFCVRCFSGVAFHARHRGRDLTFEVFGVYQGTFAMVDRQTRTVWSQLTGDAMIGERVGERLEQAPLEMMPFERWLELYPQGLTPEPSLLDAREPPRPGLAEEFPWWDSTVESWDERLARHTLVLGVSAGGAAKAFVLDIERPGPRLHMDEVGGVPVALLAEPGTWPRAYERRLHGRVVELREEGERILDRDGNVWSGRGEAVEGPDAGATLPFLSSQIAEWYAWAANYAGSEIAEPLGTAGGTP